MPTSQVEICTCGRSYVHCKRCGRRNPYFKKLLSRELSAQLGREIAYYSCQCGFEFNSDSKCVAPKLVSEEPPPVIGTTQYIEALNEFALNLTKKKKLTLNQAYVEAVRQGWSLEGFELTDELRELMIEEGLMEPKPQSMSEVTQTQAPALEDIIKAMQEEQK